MWEGRQGMNVTDTNESMEDYIFYYHQYQDAYILDQKLKLGIIEADEAKI